METGITAFIHGSFRYYQLRKDDASEVEVFVTIFVPNNYRLALHLFVQFHFIV